MSDGVGLCCDDAVELLEVAHEPLGLGVTLDERDADVVSAGDGARCLAIGAQQRWLVGVGVGKVPDLLDADARCRELAFALREQAYRVIVRGAVEHEGLLGRCIEVLVAALDALSDRWRQAKEADERDREGDKPGFMCHGTAFRAASIRIRIWAAAQAVGTLGTRGRFYA